MSIVMSYKSGHLESAPPGRCQEEHLARDLTKPSVVFRRGIHRCAAWRLLLLLLLDAAGDIHAGVPDPVAQLPDLQPLLLGELGFEAKHAFLEFGEVCSMLQTRRSILRSGFTVASSLDEYHKLILDYESLAFHIGGKWWKLATEISIVILLIGTIVGSIQQGSRRVLMILSVVFIVAPLCLVEKMRQEHRLSSG
ncbi:hypothetical protein SELMODRAFT_427308 [Selaginella moellendorffii]|uniref:Uncharacterized protein n=1 Tax=Selaginella moellendorffii TaxID=88036 RepID=D8SZ70_SELML|nr:hypothetical protein SELMODRAFT_427308 [Selaginella moellendorffii]